MYRYQIDPSTDGGELREFLSGIRDRIQRSTKGREAVVKFRWTELGLQDFLVYSPENSALRIFQAEGQILPLGVRGEGLFAHLEDLSGREGRAELSEIMERLELIEWFDRFEIPDDLAPGERLTQPLQVALEGIEIKDQRRGIDVGERHARLGW